MSHSLSRPRRSVLFVPATNEKAIAKLSQLACDAVIFDLEDAVLPEHKAAARERLAKFFAERPEGGREYVVRINSLASPWGADDLAAAGGWASDGVVLPKVETARDLLEANDVLDEADAPETLKLWAMIETPRALLNLPAIAELGRDPSARLSCLIAGLNDLAKDTGVKVTPDRRYLRPWLMQMVLCARAGGIDMLDSVSNDFRDLDAFGLECGEAAAMGFSGKSIIHPAQIGPANAAFSPPAEALVEARAVVDAFARPENVSAGVISLDGKMVERLHLAEAERLLARAVQLESLRH
ncbi:HpcH/HpaI aldolase/citrate lyase family protein [Aminobacter sp. HY435]|uniref:HpcH/HpaI aldolase/citrate lyase family protein n=1 Tax=Aminobacter sp. HY435 TaxID=2970917 RepID=UPI0022B958CB|nr:CoA ester lyase [Aminobacter sp. HY435]